MSDIHRVYLIPGMFGFSRLAGYDYFVHVQRALTERLSDAGVRFAIEVVPTPPTASIRRRARVAAETIHASAGEPDGPVHLVGHSTGGLDARLLASPTARLDLPDSLLDWRGRLRGVVTLNAPHYGTPLAGFFATVSGTRLLYALSLLTVTTLSVGGPPLTVFSSLIAALGGVDEMMGVDIQLLDRTTELLLRFIGDRGREDVKGWLDGIQNDQGGIIQITPEGMDLFNATAEDADDVRYGCLVTSAPPPAPVRFVQSIRSPYAALSATIYSTLYAVTSMPHRHYPSPAPDPETAHRLEQGIGVRTSDKSCDGIVPTHAMLWGDLLWCGAADHLDAVGHFHDDDHTEHTDWLTSGAHFNRQRFADAMDAVARFILAP